MNTAESISSTICLSPGCSPNNHQVPRGLLIERISDAQCGLAAKSQLHLHSSLKNSSVVDTGSAAAEAGNNSPAFTAPLKRCPVTNREFFTKLFQAKSEKCPHIRGERECVGSRKMACISSVPHVIWGCRHTNLPFGTCDTPDLHLASCTLWSHRGSSPLTGRMASRLYRGTLT